MFWILASEASAYPFFIRHGYDTCAQCHVDPSGGGALTEYGQGQSEILLRTAYRKRPDDWEPGKIKDFLFGVVPLPESLTLQYDGRGLLIPEPDNARFIAMQSDLRMQVALGKVRAYAEAGVVSEGGYGARITSRDEGINVVSRQAWLGWDVSKGVVVRGGRMSLPFGIRSEEHLLYARTATRTDTNDDGQFGVAAFAKKGDLRGEVMGIAGNFQVSPDDFRERGYSAYVGWSPAETLDVGISSLVTHAEADIETLAPRTRQAHGAFVRAAPLTPLAILGEAVVLHDDAPSTGAVGYLQLDLEPLQGLHVKGTGEWCDDALSDDASGVVRESATVLWFLAPHADIRVDALHGTLYCTPGVDPMWMGLTQFHVFL